MSSTAIGVRLDPRSLGNSPRVAVALILRKARRRLLTPNGAAGLTLVAFMIGMLVSAAGVPPSSDVERLETALFAQAAQLAQLGDQLSLSEQLAERLAAVQRYSAQHGVPADVAGAIYDAAMAEGLRPELAFRLVKIESGFRRTAISSAGAIGYTQIKPSTAQWVDPTVTRQMLFDTGTNLRVGFRYLGVLLSQYAGNERLALLAYNRGPGRVGELLAAGRDPTNGYAKRVLAPSD
jgi:soluble lytic murein transglycosylase-like protein